jgi:hypothetical protein
MSLARRIAPLGWLAALALAYFASLVVHPSRTLYADHSDLIALHVPWETFLARSWRETGERPLWNPLQFAGLPFAHDVQAAISYPPHQIFHAIDTQESAIGAALSWLIVGHVVLAGWGMYAYARTTGLGPTAAFISAIGFMFAGKWLLHLTLAGHYAFIGLAWLPWAALGLHTAIRDRSPLAATWAGIAFGLLALSTHPQLTLYSGLFLAIWTFSSVLPSGRSTDALANGTASAERGQTRTSGLRLTDWAVFGLLTAIVAGSLASVQLLPGFESTSLASRGVSGLPESPSLSLRTLLRTFGPSPGGVQPVVSWEPRSGLGAVWIAVACVSLAVTTGPARRRAWWGLGIVVGMTVFALGGAAAVQTLPLFRLFRQPSRIFLLAAFPIADLAGLVTQSLLDRPTPSPSERRKARRVFTIAAIVMVVILTIAALSVGIRNIRPHPYWFSLVVTLPLARWLVGANTGSQPWRIGWIAVLLVDLVAQTWPHVQTCRLDEILAPAASALYVAEHSAPLDRVLDRHIPASQSSTPLGPAVATSLGLHQIRGYNPLDIVRTKQYFGFISAPARVGHPYNGLINAPIYHKSLLDLIGVRFLVQPTDPALRSTPGEPNPDLDPRWRKVADDPSPVAFSFAQGGVRRLPPYEVLENPEAFPRAFVVPSVARLPDDRAEITRVMTSTDFHRLALIESPELPDVGAGQGTFHPATIRSYQPNHIEIVADGPGLLVLADPWYPGWTATLDSHPTPILHADFLFRGIPLTKGNHTITFAFQPISYAIGRTLSLTTWAFAVFLTLIAAFLAQQRRTLGVNEPDSPLRSTPTKET